jgi:hypothetical protein
MSKNERSKKIPVNIYEKPIKRYLRGVLFFSLLFSLLSSSFLYREAQGNNRDKKEIENPLFPIPKYSPAEVVSIQLQALQSNNSSDKGIALTFMFASPSNRVNTGPLERFTQMLKGPLYSPMLNHIGVEYDQIDVQGDRARQRVKLLGKGGRRIVYIFFLSKQYEEPYKDCWMTDAVIIESWEEESTQI